MFNKDALAYLVGLGETEVFAIDGCKGRYTSKPIHRVYEQIAETVNTTTLTALVDYIKSGIDSKSSEKLLVHVISPHEVKLLSELNSDRCRETYMTCSALLPSFYYGRFIGMEEFNIMLQSSFVDNHDKTLLLKVAGCVQEKDVKEVGDDGVSQAVTMRTGIAKVSDVVLPNPVTLAPYRTFPEIEQPQSRFIFRMQNGPTAALFEADGGAWRNEAMSRIAEWLEDHLKDEKNIKIIA